MDYSSRGIREAKSQPALPQSQRIWAASGDLPRTRSLCSRPPSAALERPDPLRQRPPSAALERPESRLSRPSSRAGRPSSRTGPRLERRESAAPRSLVAPSTSDGSPPPRPLSGAVRPLSGRVFMRRTTEKGWVAKAYPAAPSSQTDLAVLDDLSDAGSLDSFFDDEFDLEQPQEKLNSLLSCNTLGVEARVRKPDWTAGDIAIPKFHCPRCRDHWYGITDFPCDEELARLIREGLWYTGKGEVMRSVREAKTMALKGRPTSARRDFSGRAASDGLPGVKHSRARVGRPEEEEGEARVAWREDGESEKKKSRRRITFKIDNEMDNDREVLKEADAANQRTGRQESEKSGHSLDTGSDTMLGNSGMGVPREQRYRSQSGADGNSSGGDRGSSGQEDHGGGRGRRRGRGGEGEIGNGGGLGQLDSAGERGLGTKGGKGGRGGGGSGWLGDADQGGGGSGARNKRGEGSSSRQPEDVAGREGAGLQGGSGRDQGRQAVESLSQRGLGAGGSKRAEAGIQENFRDESGAASVGRGALDRSGRSRDPLTDKTTSSGRGSCVSLHSSSGAGGGASHVKGAHKAGGPVRPTSPSQSDWGDPYHARPYISSTATSSRAGSTSNLLRDQEEEEEEEERGGALPPIVNVPAISGKKPLFNLSDLFDGIQFTRAWTFSYHNAGPLTARK